MVNIPIPLQSREREQEPSPTLLPIGERELRFFDRLRMSGDRARNDVTVIGIVLFIRFQGHRGWVKRRKLASRSCPASVSMDSGCIWAPSTT